MKPKVIDQPNQPAITNSVHLPTLITEAGPHAARRYVEFFVARIRNPGTRAAYGRATRRFLDWCGQHEINLHSIAPIVVGTYVEQLGAVLDKPTVKLHLSAIRMLFDFLVVGQIIPWNPAAPVRGPKHVVKKGKTPVLSVAETRQLIDSIDTGKMIGLRDRALIGLLVYSFARVSAAIGMNVSDYFPQGRRMWFRLREKGGKHHDVPAHRKAMQYVDEYLLAAGIRNDGSTPLFRTFGPDRRIAERRLHRNDVLRIVKRRARSADIDTRVCCHTFRATGITTYLLEGQLEHAQRIAGHESIRTTKLYDRTRDTIEIEEIERIRF